MESEYIEINGEKRGNGIEGIAPGGHVADITYTTDLLPITQLIVNLDQSILDFLRQDHESRRRHIGYPHVLDDRRSWNKIYIRNGDRNAQELTDLGHTENRTHIAHLLLKRYLRPRQLRRSTNAADFDPVAHDLDVFHVGQGIYMSPIIEYIGDDGTMKLTTISDVLIQFGKRLEIRDGNRLISLAHLWHSLLQKWMTEHEGLVNEDIGAEMD